MRRHVKPDLGSKKARPNDYRAWSRHTRNKSQLQKMQRQSWHASTETQCCSQEKCLSLSPALVLPHLKYFVDQDPFPKIRATGPTSLGGSRFFSPGDGSWLAISQACCSPGQRISKDPTNVRIAGEVSSKRAVFVIAASRRRGSNLVSCQCSPTRSKRKGTHQPRVSTLPQGPSKKSLVKPVESQEGAGCPAAPPFQGGAAPGCVFLEGALGPAPATMGQL